MQNKSHLKAYIGTFLALMALLVVTVGIAFIHLGPFGMFAAMSVSIMKTVLVILIFMHVKWEGSMIKLFAAAGWYWLLILFVFLFSDYLTRP